MENTGNTYKLVEVLQDLKKVLQYLREEPDLVMPKRQHEFFVPTLFDCDTVLTDLIKEIEDLENKPKPGQKWDELTEAGLTGIHLDFKHAVCKQTYHEWLDTSNMPLFRNADTVKKNDNIPWYKKGARHFKKFFPSLKKYLKTSGTVVGSLAKVFGISEKLNEVIKMIAVGIDIVEPYFIGKSK